MHLDDLFDTTMLQTHIAEGNVRVVDHPSDNLAVLNYTKKAQYDRVWDDVTENCRGLIVNSSTFEVVARPFRKFYNFGDNKVQIPWDEPFETYEKMDGSLGIYYVSSQGPSIATRGSFTSDQALHATEVLRSHYSGFKPIEGYTYLFEIIYPSNRIVLDYGDVDDLCLLAVVDNETGRTRPLSRLSKHVYPWTGPVVPEYKFRFVDDVLDAPERENHEGYVLYFPISDVRVKIKHAEYVRLHYVMTGISNKTVWETLSTGGSIQSLVEDVPDEFFDWVSTVAQNLQNDFDNVYYAAAGIASTAKQRETRKEQAELILRFPQYAGIAFGMLDGKDVAPMIWKRIKPSYEKPFTKDLDNG